MSAETAERCVTASAVIVGGVYLYRRLVEGSAQTGQHVATKGAARQLAGQGPPPPLSHWLVAYGFAFLAMSLIAQAAPGVGGGFALTTAVGTLLAQGQQLADDLNGQLGSAPAGAGGQAYAIRSSADSLAITPSELDLYTPQHGATSHRGSTSYERGMGHGGHTTAMTPARG